MLQCVQFCSANNVHIDNDLLTDVHSILEIPNEKHEVHKLACLCISEATIILNSECI